MKKKVFIGILLLNLVLTFSCFAATYEQVGFITKTVYIDNLSTVTGSVLYQTEAHLFKDTITFRGNTTNAFTAEFTDYVGDENDSSSEIEVFNITLPLYNGSYIYRKTVNEDRDYNYGKTRIFSSAGTDYLIATEN